MNPSKEFSDLNPPQQVEYVLCRWTQGTPVKTLSAQYGIPRSTIYYWIARYQTHRTYQRVKSISHRVTRKVTDAVRAAVLAKHKQYPKLGCWRLSLFEYEHLPLLRFRWLGRQRSQSKF